ncbi:hypothetical protein [Natronobacterium texcoconense]|uniref:Uncharacterized protein n=1 Tax=Natronobacterium texcoconense TaxID=1095778 RepID=A0A1H1HZN2_NATTX|nr:hypothetical protein [Natronobacterium texcoconense]SDR30925.1 hypothetical protein SAMN04489842_3186 [Natronobacterium texcoconense]
MSAEQRPPSPSENRPRESSAGPEPSTDVELEFQPADETPTRTDAELHSRIERTKLQARVTALERALETREHQRAEIVTQYERILEERTDETEDETAGLLARLLERWR